MLTAEGEEANAKTPVGAGGKEKGREWNITVRS